MSIILPAPLIACADSNFVAIKGESAAISAVNLFCLVFFCRGLWREQDEKSANLALSATWPEDRGGDDSLGVVGDDGKVCFLCVCLCVRVSPSG